MSHTKHHMKMKARGGATSEKGRTPYNAQGSNEMKEVHEKKGGGAVHGHKGKHRVRKARGGSCSNSTASPFSSAHRG